MEKERRRTFISKIGEEEMPKLTKKDVIVKATMIGFVLTEKKHKFFLEREPASDHTTFVSGVNTVFEADSLKEIHAFLLGFEEAL